MWSKIFVSSLLAYLIGIALARVEDDWVAGSIFVGLLIFTCVIVTVFVEKDS